MAKSIERKLSEAGYKLLGESEIENIILSIIGKKDNRFLKAIPYLIYLHSPDLDKINAKTKNKKLLGEIINITRKIFEEEGIQRKLPQLDKITTLNFEEFKQEFNLQKRGSEKPTLLLDKEKIYAERNLQMWLSRLFTKKEKYIIQRILGEKPISKTDYEYYSRKTKKKLNAIINLKNFAKTVFPLSPKIDQELFELKKYFESFGEGELKRFFIINNKVVSFSLGKQNFIKKLSQIKDKHFRELIEKYKEHDFE
ncbi:MAG: hypothetical protein ABIH82_04540 [Candidatus Woesearchaeota archaeon]